VTETDVAILLGLLVGPGSVVLLWFCAPLLAKGVSPIYIGLGTLLLVIILILLLT
jgi:hypothetical protein